jgi:SAM-dependent methyltransferase
MSEPDIRSILANVRSYFDEKITKFGPNHLGVGWNSTESQVLRFEQFRHLFGGKTRFSLNDIGCGYGHLLDYLHASSIETDYLGIDISEHMIDKARELHPASGGSSFEVSAQCGRIADYSVASGIFNVKMDVPHVEWTAYVLETIDSMNSSCSKGFAFNALTRYSDKEKMRDDLYYADPGFLFDLCKTTCSRNVALLHDYGLYEFTLIVKK